MERITDNYTETLPSILTGKPVDYRNRTPHPPLLAQWYCGGSGSQHHPVLPAGQRQTERVVSWSAYTVGIIHGDDGNTYAWQGDNISLDNVKSVYLLAEGMHI